MNVSWIQSELNDLSLSIRRTNSIYANDVLGGENIKVDFLLERIRRVVSDEEKREK